MTAMSQRQEGEIKNTMLQNTWTTYKVLMYAFKLDLEYLVIHIAKSRETVKSNKINI